eukprot:CAMPEP_0184330710 /NCGR_PEP_ID=MMETSP1049-20130417/144828_1 /TAXON_ID=77928 /ORGANISM="Proteomonas sulcata, Strain CCMP704" /LENGTH=126 /DNA_ID=CAMNT_0026653163 /DNA_START=409 /DNA_END=789 /DNA_ORIENTATION=-
MNKLDKKVSELSQTLEEILLPSVSIAPEALPGSAMPENAGDQQDEFDAEKNFYSSFYPHLFRFDNPVDQGIQASSQVGLGERTSTENQEQSSEMSESLFLTHRSFITAVPKNLKGSSGNNKLPVRR